MSKYIIIDSEAIQKRIEELEKEYKSESAHQFNTYVGKLMKEIMIEIMILKQILSQSTPLIPEIEKAFDEGQNRMQHEIIERLGLRYQTEQISQSTILNMEVHSEDYISNLKLDI